MGLITTHVPASVPKPIHAQVHEVICAYKYMHIYMHEYMHEYMHSKDRLRVYSWWIRGPSSDDGSWTQSYLWYAVCMCYLDCGILACAGGRTCTYVYKYTYTHAVYVRSMSGNLDPESGTENRGWWRQKVYFKLLFVHELRVSVPYRHN